ncbi:MAG: DUF262 domain-containing protein [Cyanobacteria bacterium J06627_3]
MSLETEISQYAAKVSTDSYSMSVGELISMYRDGELNIHPEFQRFFRWKVEQKSRFLESLLLGIPVPPVFVSEQAGSKWDVIDGLQRLSSIFELTGDLLDENGKRIEKLRLTKTKYLPSLEGKIWESENESEELAESARIKIKRSRLDVNIVKNTSDDIAKYEIFQRLNTGGSPATDQEVRNCILIMTNRDFFYWIKYLAESQNFLDCILLTERAVEEAFDLELVTRFIVLSKSDSSSFSKIEELGTFLTDEIVREAENLSFERDNLENVFHQTFQFLAECLSQDSFRKYNVLKNKYYGGTLVSLFEVLAIGIGRYLLAGKNLPDKEAFIQKHQLLATYDELNQYTKSGVRSSTRIPKTIEFGKNWLDGLQE